MGLKDFIRSITPQFLLEANRKRKKQARNAELNKQRTTGTSLSKNDLKTAFRNVGIDSGDTLLVHSSLSKIGYVEDGPKTVVNALLEILGEQGNLLMPTSPNAGYQLEYIKDLEQFDVKNAPSKLGAISEYFRKLSGVIRSTSPTEPVSAYGPDAEWLTSGHLGEITPYTENSPFRRIMEKNGKILYLGVSLDNAGTNLHTLEDAVDFPYPVYFNEAFDVKIKNSDGETHSQKVKVHNPAWSAKRKCDELLPMFYEAGCYQEYTIGEAKALLFDAKKMFDTMIDAFNERGVTMYHPKGTK